MIGFCRSFGSRRTCGLSGLSVLELTQLQTKHTYLVLTLSFAELPCIMDPLEFCAHGASQM